MSQLAITCFAASAPVGRVARPCRQALPALGLALRATAIYPSAKKTGDSPTENRGLASRAARKQGANAPAVKNASQ